MATTRKIERVAAMRLGLGKTAGATGWAFGGSTIQTLGANNGFAYVTIDKKGETQSVQDESIDQGGFMSLPVQTRKSAMFETEGNVKYRGFNKLLYWMFGYEDGGSSPQNLGGGYYRHVYELDKYERHYTSYRTAEQTDVGYLSTDRKNRAADFAYKEGTNDHRYAFAMCQAFSFSSSASDLLKWGATGRGYQEERGDYSSSTWTLPTGQSGSSLCATHQDLTFSIGPSGALVTLGVSDLSIEVEVPLALQQDSESGKFLIEPVFEGKYTVNVSFIVTRHSADTYLAYRDSWQQVAFKAVYASGSNNIGLYCPALNVVESEVSEEDVPNVPVVLRSGPEPNTGVPVFTTELGTVNQIQFPPLFCIAENEDSTNEMRRE